MASFSTLDDDLVVSIASYGAPEDLLNLALTCRRLGSKLGAATQREWRALARDAKRQKASLRLPCREWSLVDEAARCVMDESMIVEERICLPPRDGDSWMGRYHELIMLRRPLTFDQLFGDEIAHGSEDKTKVRVGDALMYQAALSSHIMRAGKHYATFTMTGTPGSDVRVGVFRPSKGLELETEGLSDSYGSLLGALNKKWGDRGQDVNYCALNLSRAFNGVGIWAGKGRTLKFNPWRGQERFGLYDTVGLLLDLDEGTLAVYKNGRRLGVMNSGLAGDYCWGIAIGDRAGKSVKISRTDFPPFHT